MASKAGDQILMFAVKWPTGRAQVAGFTFGHDLIIVLFSRVVHVVLPVAAHTIDLVFGPGLFDGLKN